MDKVTQLQEQLTIISTLYFQSIKTIVDQTTSTTLDQNPSNSDKTIDKMDIEDPKSTESLKNQVLKLKQDILKANEDFDRMLDELPGLTMSLQDQEEEMRKINALNEEKRKELINVYEDVQKSRENSSECLKKITEQRLQGQTW